MQFSDTPMRAILESAYLQGMNDMFDALDAKDMISAGAIDQQNGDAAK
jgi:hypothetical protein